MRLWPALPIALILSTPLSLHAERDVSLRGSPSAMVEQNRVAKELGLSFYRTGAQIRAAAAKGELVRLDGTADYDVADFVSYPFVNPAVALFVERLAAQYREACDQKLVVTSGARPTSGQPANAHALSVHPVGMAVDLRVSDRRACRAWLEDTLLSLEANGLLNGTRERNPPHYHVAIFPTQYLAYANERIAEEEAVRAEEERRAMAALESATNALVKRPAVETPNKSGEEGDDPLLLVLSLALVGGTLGAGFLLRR